MNDNQIISFLESRAKKIGQANGFGSANPQLEIMRSGNNLFLGVRYIGYGSAGVDFCSLLRFKQNGQYGMFKLTSDSNDFIAWKNQFLSKIKYNDTIAYSKANVPESIKHLVVSTIIKALNTSGMALTITMINESKALINENENYESICIEYDLNIDEFMNL